jgi:membrane fusion protein (multidrug efflux system)
MSENEQGQEQPQQPEKKGGQKRRRAGLILALVIVVGVLLGGYMWFKGQVDISTDDAFIQGHIHEISPRVPGYVKQVLVEDNQFVHKGDLLVELDPSNYQARVRIAQARLDVAQNETSGNYAQVQAARAGLSQVQARLEQADLDLERGQALFAKKTIPKEQFDRLVTARKVASSQVREAKEALRRARALLGLTGKGGKEALVEERQAELHQAKLNLSYTRIFAPSDGYVTRKSVEVGNNVQAGQPLLAVVRLADTWVTANYKESDLAHMRPGQPVKFTVDAYPGETFTGTVNTIMAGTGAAFSLLPPENATGNYVKVVQRVPVKIFIDHESDPQHKLRVGMSVVPTVETGRSLWQALREALPF